MQIGREKGEGVTDEMEGDGVSAAQRRQQEKGCFP